MKINLAVIFLALRVSAADSQVSVDQAFVQPGSPFSAAVRFEGMGNSVAGLQFDLTYDPSMPFSVTAGQASDSAGKQVYSADLSPTQKRFLIAGLNRSAIGDGVVASLAMVGSQTPGTYPMLLSNVRASDPGGSPVSMTASDGGITVGASSTMLTPLGIFTQVASGGTWKTTFTLLNLSDAPSTARLAFWDNNGVGLPLPIALTQNATQPSLTSPVVEVMIPANGIAVLETVAPDYAPLQQGWAQLSGGAGLTGSAAFSRTDSSGRYQGALVSLEARAAGSFVIPFDNTKGFVTSLAMATQSDTGAVSFAVTARDEFGQVLFVTTMGLAARGHDSFETTSRFPSLGSRRGTLEFQNLGSGAFAVLGLRFSPAGSFTSIPSSAK